MFNVARVREEFYNTWPTAADVSSIPFASRGSCGCSDCLRLPLIFPSFSHSLSLSSTPLSCITCIMYRVGRFLKYPTDLYYYIWGMPPSRQKKNKKVKEQNDVQKWNVGTFIDKTLVRVRHTFPLCFEVVATVGYRLIISCVIKNKNTLKKNVFVIKELCVGYDEINFWMTQIGLGFYFLLIFDFDFDWITIFFQL